MTWLQHLSIKRKLTVLLMAAAAAAVVLAGATAMVASSIAKRSDLVRSRYSIAGMLGENCMAALSFNIPEDAAKVLESLKTQPTIRSACVYDSSGAVFATYGEQGDHPLRLLSPADTRHEFTGKHLHLYKTIYFNNQALGAVFLCDTMASIKRELIRDAFVLLAIILAAVAVTRLLAGWLQGFISRPILKLAALARAVSDNKDYTLRARKEANDEVGLLIDAFNAMLAQIQKRDSDLHESETKYRTLTDNITIGVFRTTLEEQGRILHANQALAKIYGTDSLEEMYTIRIADIYWTPSDRAALLKELFLNGQVQAREILLKNKKGEPVWCAVNAQLLYAADGTPAWMDGTIENITERKRAEALRRESEQRLADIIDFLPDATFVIDNKGKIIAWNRALEEMTGVPKAEMLGKDRYAYAVPFYGEARPLLIDLVFLEKKEIEQKYSFVTHRDKIIIGEAFTPALYNGKGAYLWGTASALFDSTGALAGAIECIRDISDRRQAQKALIESRERLDLALKGASLGMWDWDIDTGKIVLNERWANIVGYRLSEINPNFAAFEKMIHPEDAPGVLNALREHLAGKTPAYQSEHRLLTKSGGWIWVLDCGRVVERDAAGKPLRATGTLLDIDERIKAEESRKEAAVLLRESEAKYRDLVESASAVIITWDSSGNMRFFNEYAEKLFGFTEKEVLGKNLMDTIVPRTESTGRDLEAMIKDIVLYPERFIENLNENITKDGRRLWVRWTNRAILSPHGSVEEILSIGIDNTARKQAEEAVKAAQEQLIQADKLAALGTLVAGVAHEINNPNNFVMLNTPLIQEIWKGLLPVLEEYYREQGDFKAGGMTYSRVREGVPTLLNGILDGARRISSIVKELKDFVRPDAVSMNQKVDINEAVKAAVSLLQNAIKKATTSFTVTYGENLPPVTGNIQRLEQVFINLILNACQALPDSTRGIQVTTASDGDSISVTVKDQGKGIPQEDLSQIMNPFFTTKRGAGGTGLGLSISSKIIEEHGGRIDVHSREGEGTTFRVVLYLQPTGAVNKILIADDEENMREVMLGVLSRNSAYDIRAVENGSAACMMLGKWRPDLIVLDINMPDMNGVEVCRMIKGDPDFSNTKVVICTGHPDSSEMQDIRAMGFTDVLCKPFHNEELQRVVAEALKGNG